MVPHPVQVKVAMEMDPPLRPDRYRSRHALLLRSGTLRGHLRACLKTPMGGAARSPRRCFVPSVSSQTPFQPCIGLDGKSTRPRWPDRELQGGFAPGRDRKLPRRDCIAGAAPRPYEAHFQRLARANAAARGARRRPNIRAETRDMPAPDSEAQYAPHDAPHHVLASPARMSGGHRRFRNARRSRHRRDARRHDPATGMHRGGFRRRSTA